MRYDPKSADADLLSEGWYDATLKAEEKKSKGGKTIGENMMVITSTVYCNGLPYFIEDYFVGVVAFHMKRFKKLCEVLGFDFDAGEITADQFNGRGVRVHIKTQKSKNPEYPDDKNIAAHYAPMDSGASAPTGEPATTEAPTGEDIPF